MRVRVGQSGLARAGKVDMHVRAGMSALRRRERGKIKYKKNGGKGVQQRFITLGRPTMDGNTARGASSPAKPALHLWDGGDETAEKSDGV